MGRTVRFREAMQGTWTPATGDGGAPGGAAAPMRFEVGAVVPGGIRPLGTARAHLSGTVDVDGLVRGAPATGTMEIAPVAGRRIRYTLDFATAAGEPCRFDGWKSIEWLRPLATWTTLPGILTGEGGAVLGTAELHFPLRDLASLVGSLRPAGPPPPPADLHRRRWDGRPGRLEVWYDTVTDPVTGTGFWFHHELCAPTGLPGSGRDRPPGGPPAELRGWVAVFPPDGPPVWERFGPWADPGGPWFQTEEVVSEPGHRRGRTASLAWDLAVEDAGPPLFTFPPAAWRRELLPGAQIVPSPAARYTGSVRVGDQELHLDGAPGASARIYGHGNAERWGWLHAPLGDGAVLEVVAAVPRRRGLDRLRPLALVQLRMPWGDWPDDPLRAALRFRCHLGRTGWTLVGRSGGRRLRATVNLPAGSSVAVGYTDPDGAPATCTNSERADAQVVLERRTAGGGWEEEHRWVLEGTAHAEVGVRP